MGSREGNVRESPHLEAAAACCARWCSRKLALKLAAAWTALALAGCGVSDPPYVRPDPALLSLVPADTVLLAGARLDHIQETSFYDQHLRGRSMPFVDGWITGAGVDPTSEIWELLAAYNGREVVVMARGKFSDMGLEPRIQREGASKTSYKGYAITGDDEMAVMFVNPSALVTGPPQLLRSILDNRGRASPPAGLLAKLEEVGRENQLWAVSLGGFSGDGLAGGRRMSELAGIFGKLRGFRAAAALGEGLSLQVEGDCANGREAESLQSALRILLAVARGKVKEQAAMAALYDAVRVSRQEAKVRIEAEMPPELVDALIGGLEPPAE